MQYLTARLDRVSSFSRNYTDEGPNGSLVFGGRGRIEAGTSVIVEVRARELPRPVLLRCTVTAYIGTTAHLVAVALAETEGEKRDFLLGCARGEVMPPVKRSKERRFPLCADVQLFLPGAGVSIEGRLLDLSLGGARIRAGVEVDVGRELGVKLSPMGSTPVPSIVQGRVAWTSGGMRGAELGVVFRASDRTGARRAREIVRRFVLASLDNPPKPRSLGL